MLKRGKQILLRLTEQELEAVDRTRGDVPRERWLRRLIERELATEQALEAVVREDSPPSDLHRCPTVGCSFAAPSPRATCPWHGRKVR